MSINFWLISDGSPDGWNWLCVWVGFSLSHQVGWQHYPFELVIRVGFAKKNSDKNGPIIPIS